MHSGRRAFIPLRHSGTGGPLEHLPCGRLSIVPLYGAGCDFETAATPDSLDALFHHFIDAHPGVHANGDWPNLADLVVRGLHANPFTQYWPRLPL